MASGFNQETLFAVIALEQQDICLKFRSAKTRYRLDNDLTVLALMKLIAVWQTDLLTTGIRDLSAEGELVPEARTTKLFCGDPNIGMIALTSNTSRR